MMDEKSEIQRLISKAHSAITKHRREYAPSFYEIQAWIDFYTKPYEQRQTTK
jgi:hypothetical protein